MVEQKINKVLKLKVSIVLYRNPREQIEKVINSLRQTRVHYELDLVDNSDSSEYFSWLELNENEKYQLLPKNIGFGAAHNHSIKDTINRQISFHLVLNPDVYFIGDVITPILAYMNENISVGLVAPKVLYPNGKIQYLCKKLPTPYDLFIRRFGSHESRQKNDYYFEMRDRDYDQIMEVPSLSGCFMMFRTSILQKIKGFDERFFMYMEDVDISRRASLEAKNIHFPGVTIYHEHGQGSYKSKKLLWIHIKSTLQYFIKWGW
ncbi:MAG: glycosyltransferase family 2 protein [Deltaproteobacteria bacterium]|nr:glycosyltransferase family 2 protein [Deltaproteobacteria bacterium]